MKGQFYTVYKRTVGTTLRCIRIRLREKSHMCRKFGHGVGLVGGVETVIGPLEGARSYVGATKGGPNIPKWSKMQKPTTNFQKMQNRRKSTAEALFLD